MVAVAQLVRASDCDSEGRGFEPLQLPKALRNFGELFYSKNISTFSTIGVDQNNFSFWFNSGAIDL
jgi:hypothetical protein